MVTCIPHTPIVLTSALEALRGGSSPAGECNTKLQWYRDRRTRGAICPDMTPRWRDGMDGDLSDESENLGNFRRWRPCKNGAQACAYLGDPVVKQRRHQVKGEVGLSAIQCMELQDRQDYYTPRRLDCGGHRETKATRLSAREGARVKTLTPPYPLISY
ncbi:hypothetical protein HPB51_019796 [Rhipicephalus microplus]|uniref:Uncharacterized protein n=1 Tax=Rhipicephalus microplus TaxID=6941 RepID=A0A9J6EAV4_RHIMP|nr:hypothetical protein HPB51_019796 [Rhipicephalus microplus]